MVSRFVGADELSGQSTTLLRNVTESGEPCYITEDGKAKAVLMDINKYNALMDLVEEAEHNHQPTAVEAHPHSVRSILESSSRIIRRRR